MLSLIHFNLKEKEINTIPFDKRDLKISLLLSFNFFLGNVKRSLKKIIKMFFIATNKNGVR